MRRVLSRAVPALALGGLLAGGLWACSGTTDSSTASGGGAGPSGGGGSGGSSVGLDGGWPDGPAGGGSPTGGAGGSDGGTGGTTGGTGGSTGGTGGAGGSVGGSGGGVGVEICNNADDDGDGQIDEGLSQSCTTSCGAGTQSCSAGVWSPCSASQPKSCLSYSSCKTEPQCVASCPAAPAETCNLKDDDCDGSCDDGASCRQGVHRSLGGNEHFYTTSLSEAQCCGFTLEFQNFYYLYSTQTGSLVAFYRCVLSYGKHFYTTSSSCEGSSGAKVEGIIGYIAPTAVCGAVPLYRTSHSNGDHFYTTSLAERDNAVSVYGYVAEGIAGYVWTKP